MTVTTTKFGGGQERVIINSRPCFMCGQDMSIIKATKLLQCNECDVTEAAIPNVYLPRWEGFYEGEPLQYVDFSTTYAPNP